MSAVDSGLKAARKSAVGIANVFISHAQGEPMEDVKKVMKKYKGHEIYQWVDIFSLRQCAKNEFNPPEIVRLIHDIGNIVIAIDRDTMYFKRTFCIFEAYAAISTNSKVKVEMVWAKASTCASSIIGHIDSEHAQSRSLKDQERIHEFIAFGAGHGAVNRILRDGIERVISKLEDEQAEEDLFQGLVAIVDLVGECA